MLRFTTQAGVCEPPTPSWAPSLNSRLHTHTHTSISRFVSGLIYGPFVCNCVFVCCLNIPPIWAPDSPILLHSVIHIQTKGGLALGNRSPAPLALHILCALKSQFRRDLAGSKNLRTHYKRIIFS